MDRDELKQGIRDVNYVGRRAALPIFIWTLAVIVAAGLIGVGIWYVKVGVSGPKGAGDATRQTNSAANRLYAQSKYASLYQSILAADKNINTLAQVAKEVPTHFNKTNLTGAQNVCTQSIADYNAMATNALTAPWRPAELPVSVGDDSRTDCLPDHPTTAPTK